MFYCSFLFFISGFILDNTIAYLETGSRVCVQIRCIPADPFCGVKGITVMYIPTGFDGVITGFPGKMFGST